MKKKILLKITPRKKKKCPKEKSINADVLESQ